MGTVQLTASVALAVLLLVPAAMPTFTENSARDWFVFSCRHVLHGAGNIMAGAFESVPIIQTILYGIRFLGKVGGSDIQCKIYTGQEGRFMAYKLLVERDARVTRITEGLRTIYAR